MNYDDFVVFRGKDVYTKKTELEQQSHICARIGETDPPCLKWCGNEYECESVIARNKYVADTVKNIKKKREENKKKYIHQTTIKEDLMKNEKLKLLQKTTDNFIEILEKDNHKCIIRMDEEPYLQWCNNLYKCVNL
jgi:hypothetical protein